jgi:alpha-ribazole phosphatase
MKPLLLLRHAQTDLAGRFCGHSDPPLNTIGLQQVAEMLPRLSTWPIECVYTSDLQRARQTAEVVARHCNADLEVRPGLREIDFGQWEGLNWDEIQLRYPREAARWAEQYPSSTTPGGEEFSDFESRVLHEMKFLSEQVHTAPIAIVTHAGFMRVALTKLGGFSVEEAWNRTNDYGVVIPFAFGVKGENTFRLYPQSISEGEDA